MAEESDEVQAWLYEPWFEPGVQRKHRDAIQELCILDPSNLWCLNVDELRRLKAMEAERRSSLLPQKAFRAFSENWGPFSRKLITQRELTELSWQDDSFFPESAQSLGMDMFQRRTAITVWPTLLQWDMIDPENIDCQYWKVISTLPHSDRQKLRITLFLQLDRPDCPLCAIIVYILPTGLYFQILNRCHPTQTVTISFWRCNLAFLES